MTVCSDMLELILGPIKIVNEPNKNSTGILTTEQITGAKEDETNQSDVSIACTAMSCRIEGTKDKNNSTAPKNSSVASVEPNTTVKERTDNGNVHLFK